MSVGAVKKKIVVHPEEAEVVRLIYDWYLSNMGAKAIAERLNSEARTYRGKVWCKNRVLDIIGDEAYVGRYYFNRKDKKTNRLRPRSEWIMIPVKPIVDSEVWERARAVKEERNPNRPDGNPAIATRTLLTGIARCGLCGGPMALETAKGGRFAYYNCAGHLRRGKSACPGQRVPADRLERAVIDHMANRLFTRERTREILKGVFRELREARTRNEGRRNSLVRQLEVIKSKLTKLYEAIESGATDVKALGERITELKERRSRLQEELELLKAPVAVPLHLFQDAQLDELSANLRCMLLDAEREAAKRYLRLFIETIVITLPKVEIFGKTEALLAALQNKKAVRTGGVLTAVGSWLPVLPASRTASREWVPGSTAHEMPE